MCSLNREECEDQSLERFAWSTPRDRRHAFNPTVALVGSIYFCIWNILSLCILRTHCDIQDPCNVQPSKTLTFSLCTCGWSVIWIPSLHQIKKPVESNVLHTTFIWNMLSITFLWTASLIIFYFLNLHAFPIFPLTISSFLMSLILEE
jgi:hypothetical protein